jgi:hypothetical protein
MADRLVHHGWIRRDLGAFTQEVEETRVELGSTSLEVSVLRC